ncbi:MAG TPA: hypothetical protein VFO34_17070 [Candidatus Acidoferrales bacterium]|nr:hypothetical protein [Candidatus Acidoferrales bacterium]
METRISDVNVVELRSDFRAGRARIEHKLAVCTGAMHLEPADRAELLVLMAADADERIKDRAQNALLGVTQDAFMAAMAREDAPWQLFDYCAKNLGEKPGVADAIALHPACTATELAPIAKFLGVNTVAGLLENLDRLSTHADQVEVLLQSASLTAEQKQQLTELLQGEADESALAEAVSSVSRDMGERQSLLQRLSGMRVVQRVQLALKGGREERMTLIRDSCKVVQRAVLQSSRLTDREVESFAAMANLNDEVLRLIANKRQFRKNYIVVRNLLNNPKTPVDVTMKMLPMLQPNDLKMLSMNKNIPEALRSAAVKLHRQKVLTR